MKKDVRHIVMHVVTLLSVYGLAAGTGMAGTVTEDLLKSYDSVRTLSCEVRRDMSGPGGKSRMLSRVYFQRPDHMHVENFSPLKRRYVADGTNMHYYIQGDPKGYCRPIDQLPKDWLISLRSVPGTAMDQLLRLRDEEEIALPAAEGFSVRYGYDLGTLFAVLSLDKQRRPVRIEFYHSAECTQKTAQYDYDRFEQFDGVWIPLRHRAVLYLPEDEKRETTRFSNVIVNKPIAERLFDYKPFFKGVEFVDDFEKIYNK